MIRDLSLTLQAVLDDPALAVDFPDLLAAQVAFDRPSENFTPNVSTINLFLFDVRENLELRSNEPDITLQARVYQIRQAPIRVACSYLVTAWPAGGGDLALQEHHLLSQALLVLARYPKVPPSFLRGALVGQEPLLPMMTAKSEGVSEPHEFWAAIGNKMRPSFVVTVTISMQPFPQAVLAPEVIASSVRLDRRAPGGQVPGATARFRIGGRATQGGVAVADASVELRELGLSARTDGEGRYQIGAMPAGTYTLRLDKDGSIQDVVVAVPPAATTSYDIAL